ncbi:MAG: beta-N-acetylhexosaminidase, partial [Trebonia sp.]
LRLTASTQAGLFYGVQTIRQLLPPLALEADPPPGIRWELPCVEIDDAPRFAWRGVMLDVARHFMPKEFVYRLLDLMALHKLNVLHLHLTDDQGWRFDVQRFPLLTGVGAGRRETLHGGPSHVGWTTGRGGGYYTQADARDIVAYASARHIDVVPEIEMPGHVQAAIAAYPRLGNDPEERLNVWDSWGISENILNVEESTIEFCQQVLDEVMAVFPSRYIHVGGDECPTVQWRDSAAAQARISELGLPDESFLRPWLIGRMREHVAREGRRLVCWDEPNETGLDPSVIRMSWLEEDAGWRAARAGHDVVMTPWTATYFDLYQSQDGHAPRAQNGLTTLEDAYAYEPLGEAGQELAAHVLGTQCQFWTEYMPTPRHVEYMAFPRTSAFAEVAWSPAEKDYQD